MKTITLQIREVSNDDVTKFKVKCIESGTNMSNEIKAYIKAVNNGKVKLQTGRKK